MATGEKPEDVANVAQQSPSLALSTVVPYHGNGAASKPRGGVHIGRTQQETNTKCLNDTEWGAKQRGERNQKNKARAKEKR